jgi:hypothetical protein
LSEGNDLMAEALDRGILHQVVNKRPAPLKRFDQLLGDVLVTKTDCRVWPRPVLNPAGRE